MVDISSQVDLGGQDLIVRDLYVNASAPGQAGTDISTTDLTALAGVTAGTAASNKVVILGATKNISTITTATITTISNTTFLGSTMSLAGAASLGTTLNVAGAVSNATTLNTVGNMTGSGSILSSAATGGIGYATGAGGSVTQAGSTSTAVTLNTESGIITLLGGSVATAGTIQFPLVNSNLGTSDNVVVNATGTNLASLVSLNACVPAAGTGQIVMRNVSGASILGTGAIQFSIYKGVQA